MRDDFLSPAKELLARRVGYRCSNPGCRQPTSGPQIDPGKTVNVGVASHITAAAAGGPRHDASLTSDERTEAGNGIWLCQKCAKLIDNDILRYPAERLREWKQLAEARAVQELESTTTLPPHVHSVAGQLDALAESIVADIWRAKGKDHSTTMPAMTDSVLATVHGIRSKNEFLSLPKEARDKLEAVVSAIIRLHEQSGEMQWYGMFTVAAFVRNAASAVREK